MSYDYDRPYLDQQAMPHYTATDATVEARYGKTVKATEFSNVEYKTRYGRLKQVNNMKPPPSCGRIFSGYLVVRNLGTPAQYETWMPDHVFEEIYRLGM